MTWFLLVPVALAAGTAVSVQFGVNSQLRGVAGGPVAAAAISFIVGTIALVALTLLLNGGLPSLGDVSNAPWWVWTGDLLGSFYVFASVILTPRLGAATTVALILTGQVLASIVIDHFGLLRVTSQEATPLRLLGAGLIVAGVFFVQIFEPHEQRLRLLRLAPRQRPRLRRGRQNTRPDPRRETSRSSTAATSALWAWWRTQHSGRAARR